MTFDQKIAADMHARIRLEAARDAVRRLSPGGMAYPVLKAAALAELSAAEAHAYACHKAVR